MLFKSKIKLSFTFLLVFLVISCVRYEAKKESLVSNIEHVNDLFIKRDWSAIYEMRVDAWTHGVGNEEGLQKIMRIGRMKFICIHILVLRLWILI